MVLIPAYGRGWSRAMRILPHLTSGFWYGGAGNGIIREGLLDDNEFLL